MHTSHTNRTVWILLLALAFSGCSPSAMIEKIADDEKEKIARAYIQRLIDGDLAALASELDPSLRSGQELDQLKQMQAIIPAEPPTVTNLVGYHWQKALTGPAEYNLTYQFGYGSKWILANAAWRELPDGKRQIIGMRANSLSMSLQETNAFVFRNAGALHYLFFLAAIAIPAFTLATLVVCIRTKFPRRKWLWVIFVLLGFTSSSINWTTGEIGFSLLHVQLFGASAFASSIYSPWIISVSIPVGAIIFWLKRRSLAAAPTLPAASSPAA